jgi:hypothetical protein
VYLAGLRLKLITTVPFEPATALRFPDATVAAIGVHDENEMHRELGFLTLLAIFPQSPSDATTLTSAWNFVFLPNGKTE